MFNQVVQDNVTLAEDHRIYLERPRIHDLLERAVQGSLVAVVAGAGYGKTHAVLSFVRKYGGTAAWMQISELDNNEWRFWENFTRTVSLVNKESAVRLANLGFPGTKRQFDRYLLVPQRGISPQKRYLFVYDDFHLLRNEAVLNFLERSITSPFPNITSILISRNEPVINTVGLLSKGLLTRMTEDELRFSQEEMTAFFQLQGITLPDATAAKLYQDTEGWAFAIALAGRTLKKGNLDSGQSVIRDNVFNHIEGEIFSSISGGLQKFLIKLSLIDHLAGDLLKELAVSEDGEESGGKLIGEMERIGSFIRFDTYLSTYRIHLLLLEYLKSKQDNLTEDEKRDVYLQAGRWCAAHDLKMDAISYYEKAGAYDKLINLVYTVLPMALPDYISGFLMEVLNRAPRELHETVTTVRILRTRLLFTLRRFDESTADAWEIINRFEVQPPSAFSNRLLFASYNHLGFIGMITCVHTRRYDFAAYFEKACGYYAQSGSELRGPVTIISLGSYICRVGSAEAGDPEKFIAAVAASLPHLAITMNGCGYGMDDLAQAELAYFRGDLDRVEKFSYQALYKAQKWNQYEIENRALFYLLRLHIAQGNQDKIPEIFKLLDALLEVPGYLNRYIFYDIVLGWFYAHIGLAEKVAPWLKEDFEERELNSLVLGMESLVRVKWYIAEGRYSQALVSLESPENRFGLGIFLFGKVAIKILEAICRYRLAELDEAFRALKEAYDLAQPNALDMPFIEMGKDMYLLTGAILRDQQSAIPQPWLEKIQRNASAYAKKLAAAAEKLGEQKKDRQPREFLLSRQEMRVLIGLSQGLTREEIARSGKFSVNQVKNIISSMYLKLGAVNRADAIRIAIAMGLLKDET
ncbi:MAG: LuxR C-terminal-related transcriptional regulator [Treponema sp.]|nr:LuxR C-terminal-related transcriptional regulator [Treponema sp.]